MIPVFPASHKTSCAAQAIVTFPIVTMRLKMVARVVISYVRGSTEDPPVPMPTVEAARMMIMPSSSGLPKCSCTISERANPTRRPLFSPFPERVVVVVVPGSSEQPLLAVRAASQVAASPSALARPCAGQVPRARTGEFPISTGMALPFLPFTGPFPPPVPALRVQMQIEIVELTLVDFEEYLAPS